MCKNGVSGGTLSKRTTTNRVLPRSSARCRDDCTADHQIRFTLVGEQLILAAPTKTHAATLPTANFSQQQAIGRSIRRTIFCCTFYTMRLHYRMACQHVPNRSSCRSFSAKPSASLPPSRPRSLSHDRWKIASISWGWETRCPHRGMENGRTTRELVATPLAEKQKRVEGRSRR